MELFDPKKLKFDFTKQFKFFGILSTALVVLSFVGMAFPGLNYGIDFRGGIEAHVKFNPTQKVEVKDLRAILDGKLQGLTVQNFSQGSSNDFLVTSQSDSKENVSKQLKEVLAAKYGTEGEATWTIAQMDSVGRKVGADFRKSALLSLLYTCLLVTAYMYWRFDARFVPGAIACIFHDLALTCGFLVISRGEFSTTVVAALLTLAGYSINDTVVVFDRIRETEGKLLGKDKRAVVNEAINSTLSRTVMTAGTTLVATMVLYFLGGPALREFSSSLFVGIIVGTYSSAFIAAPLYIWADAKFAHKPGTQLAKS